MGKESASNAEDVGDMGLIPGLGRFPGGGHDNPLSYSCLENPTGGGAWQATVHGVAKSPTGLSDFTFTTYTPDNSLFYSFSYESEGHSVVSPWTIQSMEFSRP